MSYSNIESATAFVVSAFIVLAFVGRVGGLV